AISFALPRTKHSVLVFMRFGVWSFSEVWSLKFGTSLDVGCWNLEFRSFLRSSKPAGATAASRSRCRAHPLRRTRARAALTGTTALRRAPVIERIILLVLLVSAVS